MHVHTRSKLTSYVALTPAPLLMLLGWPQICIWTGSGTAYSLHLCAARQTYTCLLQSSAVSPLLLASLHMTGMLLGLPCRQRHSREMLPCLPLQGMLGKQLAAQIATERLADIAAQTAGLLPRDLQAVAADAAAAAAASQLDLPALLPAASESESEGGGAEGAGKHLQTATASKPLEHTGAGAGLQLQEAHVDKALETVRQRTSTVIGAPKVGWQGLPCLIPQSLPAWWALQGLVQQQGPQCLPCCC